jgi:hypothetical protein
MLPAGVVVMIIVVISAIYYFSARVRDDGLQNIR